MKFISVLWLSFLLVVSGCSSTVSNISSSASTGVDKLNFKSLEDKKLFVMFGIEKNNINILSIKNSADEYELSSVDSDNSKLDFDDGDQLKGCIGVSSQSEYFPCDSYYANSVFQERSADVAGILAGAILWPVGVIAIVGGGAKSMFTQTDLDQDSILKVGRYIDNELAGSQYKLMAAIDQYNSNLISDIKPVSILLTTPKKIYDAISNAKTTGELVQLSIIIDRLEGSPVEITASSLNQREEPKSRAKVLSRLKQGTIVYPKAEKNGWINVGKGWVSEKFTKPIKEKFKIAINLRENKVNFSNNSRYLLANNNIKSSDVQKVLNDKAALAGISQTDIYKLTARRLSLVDKEAFTKAKKVSSIQSYNAYLKKHPDGKFVAEATALREPLWFNFAKNNNTVIAYQSFLEAYPTSQYYTETRKLWFELAKASHTKDGFRAFLSEYKQTSIENTAANSLEMIWIEEIKALGLYSELALFLKELPQSTYKADISYAHKNCSKIAVTFKTSSNICVINYLKMDSLRAQADFNGYARAYALSGEVDDFNQAQNLASTLVEKQIIEYFALLALTDKSRMFSLKIVDEHEYIGSSEHFTFFAQEKDSSEAKIKGKVELSIKENSPFNIEHGAYSVNVNLHMKASYFNQRRSDWLGNKDWNDLQEKSTNLTFRISGDKPVAKQNYDYGNYTIAYKDVGSMGGYTLYYLDKEVEFDATVNSFHPNHSMKIF